MRSVSTNDHQDVSVGRAAQERGAGSLMFCRFLPGDRYHVLGLNRNEIKLCEGNRDALDEIEPAQAVPRTITEALGKELTEPHQTVASYGGVGAGHSPMHHGHGGKESELDKDAERFFRAVDRAVLEHHAQPSGVPLILAALPMHHHMFHDVGHNPFLIQESIAGANGPHIWSNYPSQQRG